VNPRTLITLLALTAATVVATPSHAAGMLKCTMRFDLASWSILYKHFSGNIKGGKANFSEVRSIDETLGTYAAATASMGLPKNGEAQVMTKGEVNMSLAGAGKGFGLGVTVGGMTLERVP